MFINIPYDNGQVVRDDSGTTQIQWGIDSQPNNDFYLTTIKSTGGKITRSLMLGDFDLENKTWDLNQSTLAYQATFEYHPKTTRTTTSGGEYLIPGDSSSYVPVSSSSEESGEAETGIYYQNPTDKKWRPLIDEGEYEHRRFIPFRYSSIGEFDEISSEIRDPLGLWNSQDPITTSRQSIAPFAYNIDTYFPDNWWDDPFYIVGSKISDKPEDTTPNSNEPKGLDPIEKPVKFNKKSADKITNFNPSTDTLEIDTDSFGIDSSATFAIGKNKKNVKKKLAKQDFEFLYDPKKGGLYFNENGSDRGFGNGGIVAILKGAPDITSGNLEFI